MHHLLNCLCDNIFQESNELLLNKEAFEFQIIQHLSVEHLKLNHREHPLSQAFCSILVLASTGYIIDLLLWVTNTIKSFHPST